MIDPQVAYVALMSKRLDRELPNRVWVPQHIAVSIYILSDWTGVPITEPHRLIFMSRFVAGGYEELENALYWLLSNTETFKLAVARGLASYEPN